MHQTLLRKFSLTLWKNKSAGDTTQVPAGGATAAVYKRGATVSSNTTASSGVPVSVPVYNSGDVQVGDTVFIGPDLAALGTVTDLTDTTLTITPTRSVGLVVGNRLISDDAVTLYSDAVATVTTANPVTANATTGLVEFYCARQYFDVVVSGSGLTTTLYTDYLGGWEGPTINAKDFPTIQEAIDALPPEGGTVYIPGGTYAMTTTLYTPCDRPCRLQGDGSHDIQPPAATATLLNWANTTADMIRLRGNFSSIKGIVLRNQGTTPASSEGTGRGIAIGRRDITDPHPAPGTSGNEITLGVTGTARNIVIEDVVIITPPGWGIHVSGQLNDSGGTPEPGALAGSSSAWAVQVKRTYVHSPYAFGAVFVGAGNTNITFEDCLFMHCGNQTPLEVSSPPSDEYYAFAVSTENLVFNRCVFEGHDPTTKSWALLSGCDSSVFNNCWFEQDGYSATATDTQPFINITDSCHSCGVKHCLFVRGLGSTGRLRLIKVTDSTSTDITIEEPFCAAYNVIISGGAFIESTHVNLGGDTNYGIRLIGPGHVYDATSATMYPMQYANVPSTTAGFLHRGMKMPGATNAEVISALQGNPTGLWNGSMYMDWTLGNPRFYWGGTQSGWGLINRAPKMTAAVRDANTFVDGDTIYVTDATAGQEIQIRIGGAWKYVTHS